AGREAGGGLARGLEPDARGLPGSRPLRPRTLCCGARGRPARDGVDPIRRRTPPLRGRRVRDDAAEGDLQRSAAALRVRAEPAAGELPQRSLEDGRAAPAPVPRALPAPSRRLIDPIEEEK